MRSYSIYPVIQLYSNRSLEQPMNQSINQPVKKLIDRSIDHSSLFHISRKNCTGVAHSGDDHLDPGVRLSSPPGLLADRNSEQFRNDSATPTGFATKEVSPAAAAGGGKGGTAAARRRQERQRRQKAERLARKEAAAAFAKDQEKLT